MPIPEFSRPDAALLALRPLVPTETTDAADTVGAFLHTTLRPVLKLQNDLLLAVVADIVRDHHIILRPTDQHHQLTELLGRNTKLRYTVVGLITGQFTAEEFTRVVLSKGCSCPWTAVVPGVTTSSSSACGAA